MARELSRRPRAPTRDLPSRSCCPVSPRASLRLVLAKFLLFSEVLSYFEAPASLSAMAMACRLLLTLPPAPLRPLFSSPCLNSCMTRPVVLRWRGDDRAMRLLLNRATHLDASLLSRAGSQPGSQFFFCDARANCSDRRPTQQEHRTAKVVHGHQVFPIANPGDEPASAASVPVASFAAPAGRTLGDDRMGPR